jgi:hypothetical protein
VKLLLYYKGMNFQVKQALETATLDIFEAKKNKGDALKDILSEVVSSKFVEDLLKPFWTSEAEIARDPVAAEKKTAQLENTIQRVLDIFFDDKDDGKNPNNPLNDPDLTPFLSSEASPAEQEPSFEARAEAVLQTPKKEVETSEVKEGPVVDRIVKSARSVVRSRNFRKPAAVNGGRLACALVVSSILKDAGKLKNTILSVSALKAELPKSGWEKHSGPPKRGDVIIFCPTRKSKANGEVIQGHGHAGVCTAEGTMVHNSSKLCEPVEVKFTSKYWMERGIEACYSPPRGVAGNA